MLPCRRFHSWKLAEDGRGGTLHCRQCGEVRSATAQGIRQQVLNLTTKEGLDVGDEDEKKKLGELEIEFAPLAMILKEVLGGQG